MSDTEILAQFDDIFSWMGIRKTSVQNMISDWDLPKLDLAVRDELERGLEVEEKNYVELPTVAPQLYLKYEQRPVVVYQRDQYLTWERYDRQDFNKYHLCFCPKLRQAQAEHRYEGRYVVTYNPDENFTVNLWIQEEKSPAVKMEQNVKRRLHVCRDCLREINWKNFRRYCGGGLQWWFGGDRFQRDKIVDEFDLAEYFLTARKNNFLDHPVNGAVATAISEYARDILTPEIKRELKAVKANTCEICHETFEPAELEIHHANHNRGDNCRANLLVVCHDCHAMIHKAEDGFIGKTRRATKEKILLEEYAEAQKRLGVLSGRANFYKTAAESYEKLASTEIDALYELANFYWNGTGVEKNLERARKLYRQAAEEYELRDDARAKIRLGIIYARLRPDLIDAREIFNELKADAEIIDSEFLELCQLVDSSAAPKVHARTVRLLEIAAPKNDAQVKFELAQLYDDGRFFSASDEEFDTARVKQFHTDAKKFYEDISERYRAIYSVRTVEVGAVERILNLKKLAKDGDITAKIELEKLYYDGNRENAIGVVVLRDSVKIVRAGMFEGCTNLKRIVLPENLTAIEARAFARCTSLKEIFLPESLTEIGADAFYKCKKLRRVVIPEKLAGSIGAAFRECYKDITFEKIAVG